MTRPQVFASVALFAGLFLAVPAAAQGGEARGQSIQRSLGLGLATAGVLPVALLAGLSETATYTYDARGRLIKVVRTGTVNNNVQSQSTPNKRSIMPERPGAGRRTSVR
jgi:YD repeat-containing protein